MKILPFLRGGRVLCVINWDKAKIEHIEFINGKDSTFDQTDSMQTFYFPENIIFQFPQNKLKLHVELIIAHGWSYMACL